MSTAGLKTGLLGYVPGVVVVVGGREGKEDGHACSLSTRSVSVASPCMPPTRAPATLAGGRAISTCNPPCTGGLSQPACSLMYGVHSPWGLLLMQCHLASPGFCLAHTYMHAPPLTHRAHSATGVLDVNTSMAPTTPGCMLAGSHWWRHTTPGRQ